jgi:type IV secretion system protein VirB6
MVVQHAAVVGTTDPVRTIDRIWERGGAVGGLLLHGGPTAIFVSLPYDIVGLIVWLIVGLLCVYTLFLLALSHVALAILLSLGPLFFAMAPFPATRKLFDSWLAQLTNYALLTLLTILAATLLLQIVESYATQTLALGNSMTIVDTLNMMLVSVLVFILMRQVMPIAAAVAGGATLNSFGAISRTVDRTVQVGKRQMEKGLKGLKYLLSGSER